MSRIPIRDIENYELDEDEYDDRRRTHRPHTHGKKEQEKRKSWDREVIHDPYGDDDRR